MGGESKHLFHLGLKNLPSTLMTAGTAAASNAGRNPPVSRALRFSLDDLRLCASVRSCFLNLLRFCFAMNSAAQYESFQGCNHASVRERYQVLIYISLTKYFSRGYCLQFCTSDREHRLSVNRTIRVISFPFIVILDIHILTVFIENPPRKSNVIRCVRSEANQQIRIWLTAVCLITRH